MMLGARTGAWAKSTPPAPIYNWQDGKRYNSTGGVSTGSAADLSVLLDYIPCIGGHIVEVCYGPVTADPYTRNLLNSQQYDSEFGFLIASPTSQADTSGKSRATLRENSAYIRSTIKTEWKDDFYIYDCTDGVYLAFGKNVDITKPPAE